MSGKKKVLMALIILMLFASVIVGLIWHMTHYIMVDFTFYPKNAQTLDLRGQKISVKHYEKLCRRLPGCDVQWDVPLSGGSWADDTRKLTLTSLTDADVETMDYLTELEHVQAEQCTDYLQLLALLERRPEVEISYNVGLSGNVYPQDAEEVELSAVTQEEIALLRCLSELKTVVVSGGEDVQHVAQLQEYCHDNGLAFCISIGGKSITESTETVTAEGAADGDLKLLQFLPNLKQVHLTKPKAAAESLVQLQKAHSGVQITWEQEIFGQVFSSETEEIDLSKAKIKDLSQVDEGMAYFPNAKSVFLGECGIDNEKLAEYRENAREKYKVVWTVRCGDSLPTRTDATTFMPTREKVYYFFDEDAYNLRYCEDMVCIDIGHMSISNIDFLEYMPNLEYLVLAHTQLQYIEPIKYCKKLKFLELDWSPIKDYSPLVECTALEDLNLGNTYADFEPIGKMTWLKNLWMIGCSRGPAYTMTQTLTNTKVQASGSATVGSGWRNLPNYYAMRDLLGMEYMEW